MDQFELKKINKIYHKKNFKITKKKNCQNRCYIFFSGNGLYYPNTNEEFKKKIIENDRYEWEKVSENLNAKKIIFIRDIWKIWYYKGINSNINNIKKLIKFIKKNTKEFKDIVLVGSSAGGYIASLVGSHLQNCYVISFAGQIDLKLENFPFRFNNYMNIKKKIKKTKIFYFFSLFCQTDLSHYNLIKNKRNINFFKFKSKIHGPVISQLVLKKILNMSYTQLKKLNKKNMGDLNIINFSLQIINPILFFFDYFFLIIKRIIR